MSDIDFEIIRRNVISKEMGKYPDDPYGRILRVVAETASHVTAAMLTEYEKQRSQDQ